MCVEVFLLFFMCKQHFSGDKVCAFDTFLDALRQLPNCKWQRRSAFHPFAGASNIKYFSIFYRLVCAPLALHHHYLKHSQVIWSRRVGCHSSTNESNPSSSWSDHFHLHDCVRNWCAHSLTVNEDKINGFVFPRQDKMSRSIAARFARGLLILLF